MIFRGFAMIPERSGRHNVTKSKISTHYGQEKYQRWRSTTSMRVGIKIFSYDMIKRVLCPERRLFT